MNVFEKMNQTPWRCYAEIKNRPCIVERVKMDYYTIFLIWENNGMPLSDNPIKASILQNKEGEWYLCMEHYHIFNFQMIVYEHEITFYAHIKKGGQP